MEFLIKVCSFKKEPITASAENLFRITEVLLRISLSQAHRISMLKNYQLHLESHGANELTSKLLQSMIRSINTFIVEKKWQEVELCLEKALIPAVVKKHLKIDSNESYEELFTIISVIGKHANLQKNVMEACAHLMQELDNYLVNEESKKCNRILMKLFNICTDSKIYEEVLKDLHSNHYKNTKDKKSSSLMYEKTAILVAKMLTLKIQQFETTIECFSTYHHLVVSLFHVFKSIKNIEGISTCCTDVKRHEIHNLAATIFIFATKFVSLGKFNKSVSKDLLYHISYDTTLCSGLKCQSKDREMLTTYSRIYNLLYEFVQKKSMVSENIGCLHECIKHMYSLWKGIPGEVKSSCTSPDILAWKIYEDPVNKEDAFLSANGMASLIINQKFANVKFVQASKDDKKSMMKHMFSLREATKLLEFATAAEFIKSKQFSNEKFGSDADGIQIVDIILIELCTLFRYNSEGDIAIIVNLFSKLSSETSDPVILSIACQSITDEVVKNLDVEEFKKINQLLVRKGKEKFSLEISLSLALNHYAIYFITAETIAEENKNLTSSSVDKPLIQQEIGLLGHLNESLHHFTDVVSHIMKNNADIDKVLSLRRVISILNNMAVQYYIRGIKYKDFEAHTLLWNLALLDDQSKFMLFTIGTFFLDHRQLLIDSSGNYIKISKKVRHLTIEDIVGTLNNVLDEQIIPEFKIQSSNTQCSVWSYMLSLWVHHVSNGRKTDGFKRLDQFKALWQSTEVNEDSENREAIQSKIYFCIMEINLNCCNQSADIFLSLASGALMRIKKISRDFIYHFHQIYQRITMRAISYSINRLTDMNHYDTVMASLISTARKKGYYMKLLDLLSLSILRNLNMEKVDNAKVNIK